MADVHLARPDVGFGIILYVITITRDDPLTDKYSVCMQSVRRLAF